MDEVEAGDLCDVCGNSFPTIYKVPDEVWEQIKPEGVAEGAGLLCPQCAMARAEVQGIRLYWEAATRWWASDPIGALKEARDHE